MFRYVYFELHGRYVLEQFKSSSFTAWLFILISRILPSKLFLGIGSFRGRVRTLFSASSVDELLFRRDMDDVCADSDGNFAVEYFATREKAESNR